MIRPESVSDFSKGILTFRLVIAAMVLLLLALGFNAVLTISSLEKLYIESIVSQYSGIGEDLQRNIEKSFRFGKSIDKFVGMDAMLEDTRRHLNRKVILQGENVQIKEDEGSLDDISVSIGLPNGIVRYSTNSLLVGKPLPKDVVKLWVPAESGTSDDKVANRYVKHLNTYYIVLPLKGGWKKEIVGVAVISFGHVRVQKLIHDIIKRNIRFIVAIVIPGFIIMSLLIPVVIRKCSDYMAFPKTRITWILVLVITLSQLVFTYFNTTSFRDYYLRINREKTAVLASMLKEDIEFFLSKGLQLDKLAKMDVMLKEIIDASPELENITITNANGKPLYIATKDGTARFNDTDKKELPNGQQVALQTDSVYHLRIQLEKGQQIAGYVSAQGHQGFISTCISKDVLHQKLKEIALDSATILVISILFFVELLILVFQLIEQQINGVERISKVSFQAMRPAAFIFIAGYSVSVSFMPLHMQNLYEPLWGLSRDVVLGFPISVRQFFAGLAIFLAGNWVDRKGWRQPFYIGLIITALGFAYSWAAPNAIHFIVASALAGLGYGFSLMAAQGFVIAHTDDSTKSQGLSQLWAGVYAGLICGSAAGGMLAERIGFAPVFLAGSFIVLVALAYSVIFMRGTESVVHKVENVANGQKDTIRQIFRFLTNRNIFSVMLLSSIAAELAIIGFLNYFSPIYLHRIGASQSNIGRIFMINGLCYIYVAPFISRFVDVSQNKKLYMAVGGVLMGAAFICFFAFQYFQFSGLVATTMAVLLIGISSAFTSSSRSTYILKVPVTQDLGPGKAMGIFSSSGRLGQVFGPLLFGGLLVSAGMSNSLLYLGVTYLAISVLFMFVVQKDTST